MSFLAKREFLFILLISMTFLSKAVFSQNDEAADQFQRVEDSTLDDSGKEAVDAANSAEPEHQEEAIKPHEVVPSKQEQTIQENNAQEQAGQTEEAKELKSVESPKRKQKYLR